MVGRHRYFKGLFCPLFITETSTQTEYSSEPTVHFCHTIRLHAREYCNPETKRKFQEG